MTPEDIKELLAGLGLRVREVYQIEEDDSLAMVAVVPYINVNQLTKLVEVPNFSSIQTHEGPTRALELVFLA